MANYYCSFSQGMNRNLMRERQKNVELNVLLPLVIKVKSEENVPQNQM